MAEDNHISTNNAKTKAHIAIVQASASQGDEVALFYALVST